MPRDLPIEDWIDLHLFAPREIPEVVVAYLEAAVEAGHVEVRLVHGRGVGVQRERVRSLLQHHPHVVEYRDAPPERGGWGATVVRLGQGPPAEPETDRGAELEKEEGGPPWLVLVALGLTLLAALVFLVAVAAGAFG